MNITFNDTYEIRSVIGRGGMSTVYLAEHKRLHTCWAVKEVRKDQGTRFDFLAESNILKNLDHRMLPRIDRGDLLVLHDTGAHGFSMGYNYNGKLRSAELLLREDGSVKLIRRAETPEDYFATMVFE